MIRSKISRSLIVAIFIVTIIFLGYLDVRCIMDAQVQPVTVKLIKLGYVFGILMLVVSYVYIKDKLYRIKMKRSQSLILRHLYLAILIIITNLLVSHRYIHKFGTVVLLLNLIITLITSFIIKKVIFNVSKSDILAVVSTFSYSMLPVVISDITVYTNSNLLVLFIFAMILNMQFLIDELKQRGIKTRKYLILAMTMGIFMGITCIIGVNYLVWCFTAILLLVVTINLDNTHINFPKKVMHSITQENREKLYGIERINISKLLICIFISLIMMFVIYFIGSIAFEKMAKVSDNELIHAISENIIQNNNIKYGFANFSYDGIEKSTIKILQISKSYYMVIFVYIILVESLNILLKRRYDTKSTMLRFIFVCLYFSAMIFNVNVYIFQPLFSILLVLIAVVNTSNIYLNREERVKMLVA